MKSILIGGIENHVHLLLGLPPTVAVSKAVQLIKGGSSAWLKDTFPWTRGFGWQDGYGAFTVSRSLVPEVENYIRNQREHHRVKHSRRNTARCSKSTRSVLRSDTCLTEKPQGERKRRSATQLSSRHPRGLKPAATLYHRVGRPETPPSKRILGGGEPDSHEPDQRATALTDPERI